MDTPINQVLLVIVILFNVSTAYNGTKGRLHGFRCNQLLNRYNRQRLFRRNGQPNLSTRTTIG